MPRDEDPDDGSIAIDLMAASADSCGVLIGFRFGDDLQGESAAVASLIRQTAHFKVPPDDNEGREMVRVEASDISVVEETEL